VSLSRAHLFRTLVLALGLVFVFILASLGPASSGALAAQPSELVAIRAAHHPGFDRIVFEFEGRVPGVARVKWASDLRLDPSHKLAHVQGSAFLRVRFSPALGHDLDPPQDSTFGPARRAYALPNIAHVVLLGDYEAEVTIGLGLMKKTRILRTARLTQPSRFVIDVATSFRKANAKVYFVDWQALVDGDPSYVVPVGRKVPKGGRAKAALQRLYAGPTEAELDRGLRFLPSRTRGFRDLWVNHRGVARVTVRGPCNSGGAAEGTVASQIMPTLRSRPAIDWVKIYDRTGYTEQPWGLRDSIPGCLEP